MNELIKKLRNDLSEDVNNYKILTLKEKKYLSAVIQPFREKVIDIHKNIITSSHYQIAITYFSLTGNRHFPDKSYIFFPPFPFESEEYKNLLPRKEYTLNDLGI